MPTTTIADAVVFPQDPGTSPSGTIDFGSDPPSGGSWALHAAYQSGAGNYVLSGDGGSLAFTVDSANDELTIDPGVCYITQSGGGVSVQRETGTTYGVDLPSTVTIVYAVIVPTSVTVALDADAENTVYLSVNPDTRNSATAHAGNGLGTPADPAIELGTVDSAAGTTVARSNDKPDGVYDVIDAGTVSAEALKADDTTTDTLNDADIANATSGEVPKSQGNGNLSFAPVKTGRVYFQPTEPTETPDPSNGTGGIWYEELDKSGEVGWKFSVSDIFNTKNVTYVPSVDVVVVGNNDGNYYAVNVSDGTEAWSESASQFSVSAEPLYVSSQDIIIGENSDSFYSYDPTNGSKVWDNSAAGRPAGGGVVVEDKNIAVFGTDNSGIVAVNTNDGTQAWSHPSGDYVKGRPVWVEDQDIVVIGDKNSTIVAINTSDGTEAWTFPIQYTSVSDGEWIPSEDLVVVGDGNSADGNVYALNTSDGSEVWSKFFTDGPVKRAILWEPNEGVLIVGNDTGDVFGLDPTDGTELWSYAAGNEIKGNIQYIKQYNRVVFTTKSNEVIALDPTDGTEIWSEAGSNTAFTGPAMINSKGVLVASGDQSLREIDTREAVKGDEYVSTGENWVK